MIQCYKIAAIIAVAATFSGQGAVSAATVYPDNGAVFVNTGEGYARIANETYVGPGGQVMVKRGGSATIAYEGGCIERVHPGAVRLVQEVGPCGAGLNGPANVSPLALTGAAALVGAGVGIGVGLAVSDDHNHGQAHPASTGSGGAPNVDKGDHDDDRHHDRPASP